jgi:hypothetical protein
VALRRAKANTTSTAFLAVSLLVAGAMAAAGCEQAAFPSSRDPAPGGAAGAAGAAGNGSAAGGGGTGAVDPLARLFPTANDLFTRAIVPSCADEVACHGGRAAPSLRTFAELEATLGAPCQRTVADARAIVDLCEIAGDFAQIGGSSFRILRLDVAPEEPTPPTRVTLQLDGVPPGVGGGGAGGDLLVTRSPRMGALTPAPTPTPMTLTIAAERIVARDGATLTLDLVGLSADEQARWDERVYPRTDSDIVVWDPNRNGVIGATLGGAQAVRGDARRSYLYLRLLSDDFGSRMPLLPGTWTDDATRALGCFLRAPVAANAPLELADCPPDLSVPGTSKLGSLLQGTCATAGCHDKASRAEELDLTPDEALPSRLRGAFSTQVKDRLLVDAGRADGGYLLCKLTPGCAGRLFDAMPQDRPALDEASRKLVRAWIDADLPGL